MATHPEITKERVKQVEKWKDMPDEFADKVVTTIKKLSELLYISISREIPLRPIPLIDEQNQNTT